MVEIQARVTVMTQGIVSRQATDSHTIAALHVLHYPAHPKYQKMIKNILKCTYTTANSNYGNMKPVDVSIIMKQGRHGTKLKQRESLLLDWLFAVNFLQLLHNLAFIIGQLGWYFHPDVHLQKAKYVSLQNKHGANMPNCNTCHNHRLLQKQLWLWLSC